MNGSLMSVPLDMLSGPSWTFLLQLTAIRHGVSIERLMSRKRAGGAADARMDAMATIYRHTQLSTPGVGRLFGRDHTTVVYALKVTGGSRKLVDVVRAADLPRKPSPSTIKRQHAHSRRALRNRRLVKEGYAQGLPAKEIAAKAGLAYKTVHVIASGMGLVHPRPYQFIHRVPLEKRDDYITLTQSGKYRAREAAAMLGVEV